MVTRKHLQLVSKAAPHGFPGLDAALARADAPARELLQRALARLQEEPDEAVIAHAQGLVEALSALGMDHESVAAAMLLPALRGNLELQRALRDEFGATVAELADGVIRMSEIGALSSRALSAARPEAQAAQLEALRKMLLAMVQDVRIVLIKLADHLQDLRAAVRSADPAERAAVAGLTRDIFAPLANRLGVWQIKWELEDLALRVLEPETYQRIARLLDEKRNDRERYIENVIAILKGEIARGGILAEVSGRPKHIASIQRKMVTKAIGFEGLYDVRAVRVLVDDVKDCYAVLG
ncbi:MAG: HD domain-containing protein, partial [Burkholderiales bacterium]